MENRHRSPARLLAPIALAVFAVAFLLVVATSGGGEEDAAPSSGAAEEARDLGGSASEREARRERQERSEQEEEDEPAEDVYVVKEGDTLGGIAESTGVPVERLQELNPGLDQFSLVAGQEIKLK